MCKLVDNFVTSLELMLCFPKLVCFAQVYNVRNQRQRIFRQANCTGNEFHTSADFS